MTELGRTPPIAVRRLLRQEAGFGCPVDNCDNPYLEYHHFDPTWATEQHHDPQGMIALCATHHAKADAWTVEDVRAMKDRVRSRTVAGRFEWMREDVLAVVGGNFYYETPIMVEFRGEPMIWFERDERNRLLLNVRMLSTSGEPRTSLMNNDWLIDGAPEDVSSPPNGSSLKVKYANGDMVAVRFREWSDADSLGRVFPRALALGSSLRFPFVTAEIELEVGGSDIRLSATSSTLGGVIMAGQVMIRCRVGLGIG